MKDKWNIINQITFIVLIISMFVLSGCEKNLVPTIQQIITDHTEVEAGGQSQLNVLASDPDGDQLIYLWECSGGEISSENYLTTATWTAPDESGVYYCSVSVNDGKETVTDSIQLSVSEEPLLSLNTDTLLFGIAIDSHSFSISNMGTGKLDWSLEFSTIDGGAWIKSVSPGKGSTQRENPSTIDVRVDRSGLSGGTYFGVIDISSDARNDKVVIILEVAELIVSPSSLSFGRSQSQKSLTLHNAGAGIIDFSISSNKSWLTVDQSSGSLENQTENISVLVDRSDLSPGPYSGELVISTNVGDVLVPVDIIVEDGPVLKVDPLGIDFGLTETRKSFTINNNGGGNLTWTISESLSWIVVNTQNGSTTTETDEIQLTADRSGLSSGNHSGKIFVNSNGGNVEISVEIVVPDNPVLYLSDSQIDFGDTEAEISLFISNKGGGTLNWTISESLSWLFVNPIAGSTTNEQDEIKLIASRSALGPGDHSGNLTVSSNGGDIEVSVSIEVLADPILSVSTTELDFGTIGTTLNFTIKNSGGKTLSWTVSENMNWLLINPAAGTTTTETETLTATVDRTLLTTGDYTGIVTISSNGGKAEIKVNITIPAPGEWLKFDDGTFEASLTTNSTYLFLLSQFDKPSGWKEFKITKIAISFNRTSGPDDIELFCFSTQFVNNRYYPNRNIFRSGADNLLDPVSGWNEWKVDWTLDNTHFCVGYRQVEEKTPSLHIDTDKPSLRSYYVDSGVQGHPVDTGNWAIRIFVEKADGQALTGQWLDIKIDPIKE